MSYNLTHAGREFIIEVESHSYRKRFYAIEVTKTADKPYGIWDRLGYIGSYMPAARTAGAMIDAPRNTGTEPSIRAAAGLQFKAYVKGQKTAAKRCLAEYVEWKNLLNGTEVK